MLNEEKKMFKDLSAEERSEIVEAWLYGNCQFFHSTSGEWITKIKEDNTLFSDNVYRVKPTPKKQLVIPWEGIKPECKWAAMDDDGDLVLHG